VVQIKIKINREIVARGLIDFKKFKEIFSKEFDLEKAFYNSISIEDSKINNLESVMRMLYLFTDWGNILILQKETILDVLEIVIYQCEVTDFPTYKFKYIDPDNGVIKLEETKKDRTQIYFMVFPTFNPVFEKHIEHMLANVLINWGKKPSWKLLVDLT
jgi:hypothetical protein